MELTKEDKQNIISGLINKRYENDLIIAAKEEKIRQYYIELYGDREDKAEKVIEKAIKKDKIENFYTKENKRILKVMKHFGFKLEDNDDTDDDSYESGIEFDRRSEEAIYSDLDN